MQWYSQQYICLFYMHTKETHGGFMQTYFFINDGRGVEGIRLMCFLSTAISMTDRFLPQIVYDDLIQ